MLEIEGADDWSWAGQGTRHSLFFCVLLEPGVAAQALALAGSAKRRQGLAGALRPEATLHVTLWPVATKAAQPPSAQTIALATARGGRVLARPFKVTLNRLDDWRAGRAVGPSVLKGDEGVIGLEILHRQIAEAHGHRPRSNFTAHVSLLWGGQGLDPQYVEPLTWTVREFALVHSFVGESRYVILARFPLMG